ncbi:MAG: hypothetical protein QOG17_2365, partial [Gammaproteobacteria bacterium]|nr:hypothetical protein [Gammaproteobacteria bacterium]
TVTPVSEAVAVCQLTETAIPQVADGDNTAGSDKVKGPRV